MSYGTQSIASSKVMFSKGERRALYILKETTVKNNNYYEVGLHSKNEEIKLPYNIDLAANTFRSTMSLIEFLRWRLNTKRQLIVTGS